MLKRMSISFIGVQNSVLAKIIKVLGQDIIGENLHQLRIGKIFSHKMQKQTIDDKNDTLDFFQFRLMLFKKYY